MLLLSWLSISGCARTVVSNKITIKRTATNRNRCYVKGQYLLTQQIPGQLPMESPELHPVLRLSSHLISLFTVLNPQDEEIAVPHKLISSISLAIHSILSDGPPICVSSASILEKALWLSQGYASQHSVTLLLSIPLPSINSSWLYGAESSLVCLIAQICPPQSILETQKISGDLLQMPAEHSLHFTRASHSDNLSSSPLPALSVLSTEEKKSRITIQFSVRSSLSNYIELRKVENFIEKISPETQIEITAEGKITLSTPLTLGKPSFDVINVQEQKTQDIMNTLSNVSVNILSTNNNPDYSWEELGNEVTRKSIKAWLMSLNVRVKIVKSTSKDSSHGVTILVTQDARSIAQTVKEVADWCQNKEAEIIIHGSGLQTPMIVTTPPVEQNTLNSFFSIMDEFSDFTVKKIKPLLLIVCQAAIFYQMKKEISEIKNDFVEILVILNPIGPLDFLQSLADKIQYPVVDLPKIPVTEHGFESLSDGETSQEEFPEPKREGLHIANMPPQNIAGRIARSTSAYEVSTKLIGNEPKARERSNSSQENYKQGIVSLQRFMQNLNQFDSQKHSEKSQFSPVTKELPNAPAPESLITTNLKTADRTYFERAIGMLNAKGLQAQGPISGLSLKRKNKPPPLNTFPQETVSSPQKTGSAESSKNNPTLANMLGVPVARPKSKKINRKHIPTLNVLIVEDNPINAKILAQWFRRHEIPHETAKDGKDALKKWNQHHHPLVLMDIQLPNISGLEVTEEIRKIERDRRNSFFSLTTPSKITVAPRPSEDSDSSSPGTPNTYRITPSIIVALTASALQTDKEAALSAGCNDFLTKPINLAWLEKKVVEWEAMQALIDVDGWRRWKNVL